MASLRGEELVIAIFKRSVASEEELMEILGKIEARGLSRDLNPGPRAPEARIIPLDHQAMRIRAVLNH